MLAYAPSGVSAFGLAAISNIFADRSHLGLPPLDFAVCADRAGTLRTDLGMWTHVEHGPEAIANADLIIVLPTDQQPLTLPAPVTKAITDAYHRQALIAAYCAGSFLLAETGLLDGLRATTSRPLATHLAQRHPGIIIKTDALYVDEGQIVTGTSVTSCIHMCLHLLRREHGAAVSNAVAREWMITPRRESGQTRYVPTTAPAGTRSLADAEDARLADLLIWARTHLHHPMTVNDLAKQALMSARTFARRFRAVTGTTPHAWLNDQRLDLTEELLTSTTLSIQEIARQAGFASSGVLRTQFTKRHGIAPSVYRHKPAQDRADRPTHRRSATRSAQDEVRHRPGETGGSSGHVTDMNERCTPDDFHREDLAT
ncbi:GlxA family transcriptional regulator [Nonomuraea sp. ZG12]|uniref:GlxA family transcriptional regulator n=1 Tax=Nonomuraea sp. ZG12 TaxID=3452207 RepID=UPI003F8C1ADD